VSEHAIVVFGAAVDRSGRPRRPLVRRLRRALAEATRDPAALVVVSGGALGGRPAEAAAMHAWLVAEGVDPARILLEPHARSTFDNASLCAALVAGAGVRRVTLVTEGYHMPRARLLLSRALARRGVRVPVQASAAPDHLEPVEQLGRRLSELVKLARDVWPIRQP
jgi:uncharacterized SAM-binding protein YcdF (DUF218 family)